MSTRIRIGVLGLVSAVLAGSLGASPPAGVADWTRWLLEERVSARPEATAGPASRVSDFLAAARSRPGGTERLTAKWAAVPAALPWTDLALELVVKYQQNPLRAARTLAHLHAAANDAVVRLAPRSTEEAAQAVAVHAAASTVLAHFYPEESPGRIPAIGRAAVLATAARAKGSTIQLDEAWRIGEDAGAAAIRRSLDDGAAAIWNPADRPKPAPAIWRAAPPLNLFNPTEPLAGTWRTWALADGGEIEPPPPVPFGSERYWKEAQEVLSVSRTLTAGQKRIADDWNLDKGSVTPPGVWNRRAMELVKARGLGTADTARVMAALNVAMYDALIACWRVKFARWTLRPVNAIRDKLDAGFLPYLFTPPFPGYVSGHAAASGAAAEVLAAFFPDKASELQAWAEEAAMSRLYGGIHFRSDNDEGLKLGRAIGRRVVEQALARTAPSSIDGGLPQGVQ